MTIPPISQDVALRIGLAAQVLPDISLKDFITALETYLDRKVTTETLSQLTVTELQQCLNSIPKTDVNLNLEAVEAATRILSAEMTEAEEILPIEPYQEGDLPHSIRIAVASNTGEELDGHFGSCLRYLIYQLSMEKMQLIDVRSAFKAEDLSLDKNRFRVDLIRDCDIVYLVAIGGPAAAKVIQANIYPMKKEEGGSARKILGELQQVLVTSPPPWIAKRLGIRSRQTWAVS
ncbi:MAG: dinitrogenase iron-molybdenum cofactor biosynthesis protein [Halothece sp. Uz-M2-17]|nr:dinitrogenase iron-molybdenum cofactor biosynthesis protein [Halothece sp. Uz-M2-17]